MLSTPQMLMTPGPVSSLMPPHSRPVSSPLPNVPTRHFKCNTTRVEPGMFPDLLLLASALVNLSILSFRQKNWEPLHFLAFSQTPPSSIHESSDLFGTSLSPSSLPIPFLSELPWHLTGCLLQIPDVVFSSASSPPEGCSDRLGA